MTPDDFHEKLNEALHSIKTILPNTPIVLVAAFPINDEESAIVSGGNMPREAQKFMIATVLESNAEPFSKSSH